MRTQRDTAPGVMALQLTLELPEVHPAPSRLHTDALREEIGPLACYVQTLTALPRGFVARLRLDTTSDAAEAIYSAFARHADRLRTQAAVKAAPVPKAKTKASNPRQRKAAP